MRQFGRSAPGGTQGSAVRGTAALRLVALVLAVAAATLAGCTKGATTQTAQAPTTQTAQAPTPGSGTTVMVTSGPLGSYLTDDRGHTLYLFAADTGPTSTCTGTCATYWPPLTTTGAPQAGSGAQASLLSTSARADGSTQVDYNGHPLYYYKGDAAAGEMTGQGLDQSGGLWWVVSPAGAAIKR